MEYAMSPVTIAPPPEQHIISYAGFWRRTAASLIDSLILDFILVPIEISLGFFKNFHLLLHHGGPDPSMLQSYLLLDWIVVLLWWLYNAIMESSRLQATIGKMALRIIVTDEGGNRITFGRATGRHFAKILSFLMLTIGFMMAGWTKKKQAAHDMIAGTLVIMK